MEWWLRNNPFNQKNNRIAINPEEECDPQACYDSFKGHWDQALKILQRVQVSRIILSIKRYNQQVIYLMYINNLSASCRRLIILKFGTALQQLPSHDDVLGVVNHLEQMVTLLIYDMKKTDRLCLTVNSSKCLEYLLVENILDKLFDWSMKSGKQVVVIVLIIYKL